jgi:hypothetical protein
MDSPTTFISIACHSFSGSTLLAMLVNAHPEIATISEMDGPNARLVDTEGYVCSCGQLIRECSFWAQVQSEMQARGHAFSPTDFQVAFGDHNLCGRLRYGSLGSNAPEAIRDAIEQAIPSHKARLDRLIARNEALVQSILTVTGTHVFVDTSKNTRRFKYMSRHSKLDVRVVLMIRDARGSVVSQMRHMDRSVAQAAQAWTKGVAGIIRVWEQLPEHKRTMIKYEDLCRDPQATLQGLYRFFGVDPSFELDLSALPPHHIVGNSARIREITEIRLDERWKHELSPEQLETVHRIAGRQNEGFGYR